MLNIQTIDNIYPAIVELIAVLDQNDKQRQLASALQHKMYGTAWMSRTGLIKDLTNVLRDFAEKERTSIYGEVSIQIDKIIKIVELDS